MRTHLTLGALWFALFVAACGSSNGAAPASSASAASAPSPKPTHAAAAAAAPAPAPKPEFVQKGIRPGKVVVGYLEDANDPSQCAAVTDAPAKKAEFAKDAPELAKMMKAKVVPSCPTDHVVGTCDVGLGMLDNYSGPKWTAETAKKDCLSKPHQKWVE